MSKQVRLNNGRCWQKQGDALAHFKAMLARYSVGERVGDANDHADLAALLATYDSVLPAEAATKAGAGIEYFSKQTNRGQGWSTDGFHVHRTDGTHIDFSYIDAVKAAST